MTLIERLQACTDPNDRELADEVLFVCGWTQQEEGRPDNPTINWVPPDTNDDWLVDGDQPNPLASLDAALTLYPVKPELIPTDARVACIEALKARGVE